MIRDNGTSIPGETDIDGNVIGTLDGGKTYSGLRKLDAVAPAPHVPAVPEAYKRPCCKCGKLTAMSVGGIGDICHECMKLNLDAEKKAKPMQAPTLTQEGALALLVNEAKCRALEALRANRFNDAAIWADIAHDLTVRVETSKNPQKQLLAL